MPRGAQPKVAERENRMTYAAIRLFLENGYERTTTAAIAQAAGMSPSAFFAVFANKEALLLKLTKWMYEKQFAVTHELLGKDYDPVMFYAVEPAIQLYIAEKTEGLRELYVSSYSYAATANYIHQVVTDKLVELFGKEHLAIPGRTFMSWSWLPPACCAASWPASATGASPWSRSCVGSCPAA